MTKTHSKYKAVIGQTVLNLFHSQLKLAWHFKLVNCWRSEAKCLINKNIHVHALPEETGLSAVQSMKVASYGCIFRYIMNSMLNCFENEKVPLSVDQRLYKSTLTFCMLGNCTCFCFVC